VEEGDGSMAKLLWRWGCCRRLGSRGMMWMRMRSEHDAGGGTTPVSIGE
jgi:hypothetical protein